MPIYDKGNWETVAYPSPFTDVKPTDAGWDSPPSSARSSDSQDNLGVNPDGSTAPKQIRHAAKAAAIK